MPDDHDANADQLVMPFDTSIGYQVRLTHRAFQRHLSARLQSYGVTIGMWYFLRALWDQDGVTQRELSAIVGTVEPTTLSALRAMELQGLIERCRSSVDKRKINVFLTRKGRALKRRLVPLAQSISSGALVSFSADETAFLLSSLKAIRRDLDRDGEGRDGAAAAKPLALAPDRPID